MSKYSVPNSCVCAVPAHLLLDHGTDSIDCGRYTDSGREGY